MFETNGTCPVRKKTKEEILKLQFMLLPFEFDWTEIEAKDAKERKKAENSARRHLSKTVWKLCKKYPWNLSFPILSTIVPVQVPKEINTEKEMRNWMTETFPPVFKDLAVFSIREWWGGWPDYIPSVSKHMHITSVQDFIESTGKSSDNPYGEPFTDLPPLLFPCVNMYEAKQCVWIFLAYLLHHRIWNASGNPEKKFSIGLLPFENSYLNKLPPHWNLKLTKCAHKATISIEKNGWKIQTSKTLFDSFASLEEAISKEE